MKRISVLALVAAFVAAGLAGCGEREQTALYKDGKYRGKPDTQPWENPPAPYGPGGWKQGDHESWENQLRTHHSNSQSENRIFQPAAAQRGPATLRFMTCLSSYELPLECIDRIISSSEGIPA